VSDQTIVNAVFSRIVHRQNGSQKTIWQTQKNVVINLPPDRLKSGEFRQILIAVARPSTDWALRRYYLAKSIPEVRYCEFTGDDNHAFDEFDFKKRCEHIGYTAQSQSGLCCMKHSQPIAEDGEGWVRCHASCKQPIQIKKVKPT
jgi:hypothetical protein